jgi:DNA-binding MarR family transcriptional regulator
MSGLVASLARRRLLRRRVRTGDSRFVEARITPRGAAAYRKMLALAVAEYRGAVVGFDKAEWLKRATLKMLGNIGVELLHPDLVPRPVAPSGWPDRPRRDPDARG